MPSGPFDEEFTANTHPYDWFRYPCPCCGYRTMRGGLVRIICPVCFWEDGPAGECSHNVTPLGRAQQNYELYFASHHEWLSCVRDPLPEEVREPNWEPDCTEMMLAERLAVSAITEAAFGSVSRENGVSLRETWVIDRRGSDDERAEARSLDKDAHWQDVSDEDLASHDSALSFFDDIGFRYYAGAYMMWDLRHLSWQGAYAPSHLPFHLRRKWGWGVLDEFQFHAVYRYLRFLTGYAESAQATEAEAALRDCWNRFSSCPG